MLSLRKNYKFARILSIIIDNLRRQYKAMIARIHLLDSNIDRFPENLSDIIEDSGERYL